MTTPLPFNPSGFAGIDVEVRSLDQHGDPGFMHYRGSFYTATTAARFALTQAAALSTIRPDQRISVSITAEIPTGSRTDLEFIGTAGELAAELAALPDYAPGARRVTLPAPEQVTHAAERIAASTPSLPEADADSVGVLAVEVYSRRPDPLPNSRTDIGLYDYEDAYRIADQLAGELRGELALTWGDSVLRVTHAADISDTERAAATRYTRIEELRANISVLDPVVDAEHITALAADVDELRARVAAAPESSTADPVQHPAIGDGVEVARGQSSAPTITELSALIDPVTSASPTSARPRHLVSAPPQRLGGPRASTAGRHALPDTYTAAPTAHRDHGIG